MPRLSAAVGKEPKGDEAVTPPEAQDPPPTPEEEEEAPPCDHCKQPGHSFEDCPEGEEPCPEHPNAPVIGGMCGGCTQYPEDSGLCEIPHASIEEEEACERERLAPPQPQRRPPYAVAYAVQGHLYEVALPGDATVEAVDGALVIKHALGMVAGIVGVQPMSFKEAS